MMNEYKRTYKVEGKGANTAEVSIYYSKGGMNYWTYRNEPRGYYFQIHFCEVHEHENYTVHTFGIGTGPQGMKSLVLPCERQSKKRFETACSQIDECIEQFLADSLKANDLTLVSNEYTEQYRQRRV